MSILPMMETYMGSGEGQFKSHFEEAQDLAAIASGSVSTFKKVDWNTAWQVYWKTFAQATRGARGIQVFGRHVFKKEGRIRRYMLWDRLRWNPGQLPPKLTGIGTPQEEGFHTTSHQDGGAILKAQSWSVTVNDSWLLAGVHSGQQFVAASPLIKRNVFDNKFILTVTGRELVGLALAGYTRELSHGQTSFGPGKYLLAEWFYWSLVHYQQAMSQITSRRSAEYFFEKYKQYGFYFDA
jgi:hypothetical protein